MSETLTMTLDYAGVAFFAATGALAAARIHGDIFTFAFFAAVTGVGGGTLRDILLDVPVFWVQNPGYIAVSLVAAVLVWLSGDHPRWRDQALDWLDAVGLAAYAILGTSKALSVGVHPLIAAVMGMLTASFGGVIRDVLAGVPSALLRREIYMTAATLGAALYALLASFSVSPRLSVALAFIAAFGLRAGAIRYGWHLKPFGS